MQDLFQAVSDNDVTKVHKILTETSNIDVNWRGKKVLYVALGNPLVCCFWFLLFTFPGAYENPLNFEQRIAISGAHKY